MGLFASSIVSSADGLRVQNFLRVTRIPFSAVADIRMRYQVVVETTEGRTITCYGGPVSARSGSRRAGAGDRPAAGSADAERLIEDWRAARASTAVPASVRRMWDLPALVSVIALLVWAGVAVAVVQAG
ncbi:PH domain-containing protein [Microbacterium sp. Clip185]|uniref:PH domain-containing protein n=1 Tax=Microbacterium sp. Clip185 TaxID=3025663 RepID=UPI002365DB8D|nr:PH domain-containing protein [Microbacterium sp. Clip185]WDG16947.1 PH domain-containing protein [Microbacterium sp. Clip185]